MRFNPFNTPGLSGSAWADGAGNAGLRRRVISTAAATLSFSASDLEEADSETMPQCNFFARGACRYGNNCRNQHLDHNGNDVRFPSGGSNFGGGGGGGRGTDSYRPGNANFSNANSRGGFGSQGRGGFGNQGRGGFGGSGDRGDSYRPGAAGTQKSDLYHITKEAIQSDLTVERPIYPLSCYAPGRDPPRQLIEGQFEISPEELRLSYYRAGAAGNTRPAEVLQEEMNQKMSEMVKKILADVPGAIKYIIDGENEHPNRIDICKGNAGGGNTMNTLSRTAQQQPPQSAFGSSNNPPAFGAPTPFGSANTNAFNKGPAFGSTQQNPSFGNPTPFGQQPKPAQTNATFGQPGGMGNASPFGKVGGATGTPFGQAAPAFGQQQQPSSSPFGQQPSATPFGQQQPSSSPFGQQQQTTSTPFGQQQPPTSTPFGQQQPSSSPFGQQQQQQQQPSSTPFGQQPQAASNSFGQQQQPTSTPFGQQQQSSTPFGQPSMPGQQPGFGKPSLGGPTFSQQQPTAAPAGGADQSDDKWIHMQAPPEAYTGVQGQQLEALYSQVVQTGVFPQGNIPNIPPKQAWYVADDML